MAFPKASLTDATAEAAYVAGSPSLGSATVPVNFAGATDAVISVSPTRLTDTPPNSGSVPNAEYRRSSACQRRKKSLSSASLTTRNSPHTA
jgi:hypothetical protein